MHCGISIGSVLRSGRRRYFDAICCWKGLHVISPAEPSRFQIFTCFNCLGLFKWSRSEVNRGSQKRSIETQWQTQRGRKMDGRQNFQEGRKGVHLSLSWCILLNYISELKIARSPHKWRHRSYRKLKMPISQSGMLTPGVPTYSKSSRFSHTLQSVKMRVYNLPVWRTDYLRKTASNYWVKNYSTPHDMRGVWFLPCRERCANQTLLHKVCADIVLQAALEVWAMVTLGCRKKKVFVQKLLMTSHHLPLRCLPSKCMLPFLRNTVYAKAVKARKQDQGKHSAMLWQNKLVAAHSCSRFNQVWKIHMVWLGLLPPLPIEVCVGVLFHMLEVQLPIVFGVSTARLKL